MASLTTKVSMTLTMKLKSILGAVAIAVSASALAQPPATTPMRGSGASQAHLEKLKADREKMKIDRKKMKADREKMKADRKQVESDRAKAAADAEADKGTSRKSDKKNPKLLNVCDEHPDWPDCRTGNLIK